MRLCKDDGKNAMCPIKMAAAIAAKDYQLSTMELTVCNTDCAWLGKYIDDDKTVYACGICDDTPLCFSEGYGVRTFANE